MNDTERDRMYQTALRQIAQQRAEAVLASRGVALRTQAAEPRGRSTRVVGGVLLAVLLSQAPAAAFTKKDFYDAARRWEHSPYCQRQWGRNSWLGDFVAAFSGC